MQIHVRVSRLSTAITDQVRAYAEYRIFSAIGDKARVVRRVVVNLVARELPHGGTLATCTLSARLAHRVLRISARSTHPAAATDKAAVRLTETLAGC